MFFATLFALATLPWIAPAMRSDHLAKLRQETVDMFYHGFNSYMLHAFPEDEVQATVIAFYRQMLIIYHPNSSVPSHASR